MIGGGAAGFFTAIQRAHHFPEEEITILERGKGVLEKVRISGGGRCNVTHACWDPRELVKYYPRGGKELLGPFNNFACGDTMGWFEDRGVPLKIEEDGRIFPTSDSSQSIIDCLWNTAKAKGIRVLTKTRLVDLSIPEEDGKWKVTSTAGEHVADRLVITTGSNPAVWKILKKIGHQLIDPVPSLFAFDTKDTRLRGLSGISLPWAQLHIEGEKLKADGPLLITHRGLSGPAVLRLSAWGARDLAPHKYNFKLVVNWLAMRPVDVEAALKDIQQSEAKRQLGTRAQFDLPVRLWKSLVEAAGIPAEKKWAELSKQSRAALVVQLTAAKFNITGKSTNKEEFTTAGGVDLKEIDFRSFRSKVHPTLFLAGEVLDIDAITGGFNFQAAWTGGYLIGRSK
ncbi:flavoprotein [Lewinella sp. 4G2]|nr:flavoprotein [Lewinella sp. 4G2]